MPIQVSQAIEVSNKKLEGKGVFDGFIDIDSKLHVDPSLLSKCKIPEFKDAKNIFDNYFAAILKLIVNSKQKNDRFWSTAVNKLIIKEDGKVPLGYSTSGTGGSAIGVKIANKIISSAKVISDAGINDVEIFYLVGLFESDMGPDRISDMTLYILQKNFLNYTERISKELKISNVRAFIINGEKYVLPYYPTKKEWMIFLPKSLLNDLPIAMNWSNMEMVAAYNQQLRNNVNNMIADNWGKVVKDMKKGDLKNLLLNNPEFFKDLIGHYNAKIKNGYNFNIDHIGDLLCANLMRDVSNNHTLNINNSEIKSPEDIFKLATTICEYFAGLIENNGWYAHLYSEKGRRPERFPQLLFYGISEIFCIANDIDVSREPNAGIGALDFKFSKGFNAKVNVEMKYSSNILVDGYKEQLPAYNRAEKTDYSIFLIIQVTDNDDKIKQVQALRDSALKKGERAPEIIIIDGRKQNSASKRKAKK